jgi:hypothetical protein
LKSLKSLKRLNLCETRITKTGVGSFKKALPNCEIEVLRK